MKKIFTTLVAVLAITQLSYAQWATNPSTNDAYNTNSSGKVGIGTATPGYNLDVYGFIRSTNEILAHEGVRVLGIAYWDK